MAELDQAHESYELGMHTEQLSGRTQQVFFSAEESDNLVYPWAPVVDFDKSGEIDAESLNQQEVNAEIRRLMSEGIGTITVRNPGAKHSLGVGILSRLNLHFDGSLGYFGCGLLDGPNVTVSGRVGWSCGENMMAGTNKKFAGKSPPSETLLVPYEGYVTECNVYTATMLLRQS